MTVPMNDHCSPLSVDSQHLKRENTNRSSAITTKKLFLHIFEFLSKIVIYNQSEKYKKFSGTIANYSKA